MSSTTKAGENEDRGDHAGRTALLGPNAPVADPLPPWRREMQEALSEHRRISSLTAGVVLEPQEPPAPALPAREEPVATATKEKRRKQGRALLYLAFGIGGAALLSVVALVVVGLPGSETKTDTAEAAPTAAPQARTAEPLENKRIEPNLSVAATATASAPPPAVVETTAPVVAIPASSPAPLVASAKASSTYTPLPPCTPTLRVGCRNVTKTGGTSAGSMAPNPFGTGKTGTMKGGFSPGGFE